MTLEIPVAVFLVLLVVYLGMHLVLVRSPAPRNRSLMARPGRRLAGRRRRTRLSRSDEHSHPDA